MIPRLPRRRFSLGWWLEMALWLALGVAIGLLVFHGSRAQAAPRHGRSLASCAALQARRMAAVISDDTFKPPHTAADMADAWRLLPDVAVTWEAQNVQARQAFKASATRDYMTWIETEQRCKGIDHGLDKPMDRVVEVEVRQSITIEPSQP